MKKILITGGLGYIGSHISYLLKNRAIILDSGINSNLNYKKFLPKSEVIKKKISKKILSEIFKKNEIEAVIHLAALKSVGNSVYDPINYYQNNFVSSLDLLYAMQRYSVNNLIFSSSATVYGNKNISPLKEDMSLESTNPYGSTKIAIEKLIEEYCQSNSDFKAISLRYFNPIGANVHAGLSDSPKGEAQNLMPVIIQSAKSNKTLRIFGADYNTKDGTCIRDYIHVKDLAKSHILCLKSIKNLKGFNPINIGLGKGVSVIELIKIFEKTNNIKIKYKISPRRKGDVAICYSSNKKMLNLLSWKPKFSYQEMVRDAWVVKKDNE